MVIEVVPITTSGEKTLTIYNQNVTKYIITNEKGSNIMEELRERLRCHKKKYGTTLSFIGRKIGIHRCTLSLFINDKRDLPKPIAKKLEQYLNNFDN